MRHEPINTTLPGSIALITVIVISGILLASGIAVVMLSADLAMSSKNYTAKVRMETALRTCLEESLFRVKSDLDFEGNVSYTNGYQECNALVEDDPVTPDVKIISVEASVEDYVTSDVFRADVSSEPFQLID
jgi:hypothetical protein